MNLIDSITLKTDRRVGIVIPTAARHDFSAFVMQVKKKLLDVRTDAFFVIAPDATDAAYNALKKSFTQIEKLNVLENGGPVGKRIINGFDIAAKEADTVLFMPDDFDHLLESMPAFVSRLGINNDFLSGKWDETSIKYLPYSLYLNESFMSCAVTYANPEHPQSKVPSLENFQAFKKEAEEIDTWHQAYIGLFGTSSLKWVELREAAYELFKDSITSFHSVGVEAGLPLVAMHCKMKIEQMEVPKRFEHEILQSGSKEEMAYAASRRSQFNNGMNVVIDFAKYCPEKQDNLKDFAAEAEAAVGGAGFNWPDRAVEPSEWNTQIKTTW